MANAGTFKPGMPRPPGAGRKPGTPNKASLGVFEKAEAEGCDPILFLCAVIQRNQEVLGASAADVEIDHQIAAAKELASYMYPKRKAIEHSGPDGTDLLATVLGKMRDQ